MNRLLLNSKQTRRALDLIYMSNDQKVSKRTITVYKYDENDLYAYCNMRKEIRCFKKANILAINYKTSNKEWIYDESM